MVIADIYILCVNQKGKTSYKIPNVSMKTIYNKGKRNVVIYGDRYLSVQKNKGIWYQLSPFGRGSWYPHYDHEFLDLSCEDEMLRLIFLDKDIKKYISYLIERLIQSSPVKCLYFFSDLQGYKEKQATVSYEQFVQLFEKECLCFNTVYRIVEEQITF